jgi:uncharacterized protein involved in cysteine biosynthesis
MIKNYILAIKQLNDQRVWKPVLWSSILALATFVIILIAGWSLAGLIFQQLLDYFDFLKEGTWMEIIFRIILGVFLFLIGFLFFGSIQTAYMGIFIDQVIDAIQSKHYPNIELKPPPGFLTSVITALRLISISFIVNILASPFFLAGWFFPPLGISIQVLINGYLLGKEYKITVNQRLPEEMVQNKKSFTLYGAIGTTLWLIPILNLFAPLLVCSSIFHAIVGKKN